MTRVAAVAASARAALLVAAACAAGLSAHAAAPSLADGALSDCYVAGLRNGVRCGSVQRPLDPTDAGRGTIAVHYVVVPAMARRKLADPVFLLAGGPGQSAIAIAGATLPMFARLNNRRDIVFVDQRGTGRSAPLPCPDPAEESLVQQADPDRPAQLAAACKAALLKLPYIRSERDLGLFTTWVAVRDLDAVRRALGAERIDLVGASYGTRVAIEYQRQFPASVRRTVLDGAAPPDMALPASFSTDNQAALDALTSACAAEPACAAAHPDLRGRFRLLLQSMPRKVSAREPLSGRAEEVVLTRDMVLGAVRSALYVPALAAALPVAIDRASAGDTEALIGLAATFSSRPAARLAGGMHLSVICAEDLPRLSASADVAGVDFGEQSARAYASVCAGWPRGAVPDAFYRMVRAATPVLVLSGGIDPATPPRHGERVAKALGASARHVVVANAGHGVLSIGCMRDVVFRFIDAEDAAAALAVDAGCAAGVPRPPAFRPIEAVPRPVSGPAK